MPEDDIVSKLLLMLFLSSPLMIAGVVALVKKILQVRKFRLVHGALVNGRAEVCCTVWGAYDNAKCFITKHGASVPAPQLNWQILLEDSIAHSLINDSYVQTESDTHEVLDCSKCKNKLYCLIKPDAEVTYTAKWLKMTGLTPISLRRLQSWQMGFNYKQTGKLADAGYKIRYGEPEKAVR